MQAAPVKVTPLNLMETAAIRAQIQKAVNDGTYVVAASPQQVSKYCTIKKQATTVELDYRELNIYVICQLQTTLVDKVLIYVHKYICIYISKSLP